MLRALGPLEAGEVAYRLPEDSLIEEHDRAERLVLRGSREPTSYGEVVRKAVISSPVIFRGCLLPWKWMSSRIQWT